MRADRLLSLVLLLQSRGRLSATALANELDVSVRTVYRDMVALGTAGIPVYADARGYQLVDGFRTQLTGLTADEARGLVLTGLPGAAAALGLAEAVAAAQLKLDAALPDALRERSARMRQRFHLDAPGWYQDGDEADHLSAVAEAVWEQQIITMRYETWSDVVSRRLAPYGLVLKAGTWYLVAATDGDVRTYKVNQILELAVLPERFEWPLGFDLARHWREHVVAFRTRLHQGTAVVRFAPAALPRLPHLMGRAVAEAATAGEVQPDGWTLATVPIESESHAEGAFLRLGAQAEVLRPESLRARIGATVSTLATLYELAG
ncbi:helix-turn-helix transcriptional regulator [Asanoa iriomotensis]|uniref:Transcriptional regulator n=1 Tax=Asanoa iriomotensis TaxID=234613 RepID=A0ABQ4C1F6_9ACTN|nr:transcriptional regulator [Asanoa iriomotensis]GIF56610.1 transcriptional regulator [Asanoa iriomotensis]